MDDVFYYGCWGLPGHYWFEQGMQSAQIPCGFPFLRDVDGGYAPRLTSGHHIGAEAPQGQAVRTYRDGWTLISFWDRSGDRRKSSNSNFAIRGEWSFAAAVEKSKTAFPKVWARFPFEVTEFRP